MKHLRIILSLSKPYFTSTEKGRAWGLFSLTSVCEILFVISTVASSYWANGLFTALQKMDVPAFYRSIYWFIPLLMWTLISFVSKHYFKQMLELNWRVWLTDYFLSRYFSNRAYYDLQLRHHGTDNPDQRISEDIQKFITQSMTLFFSLLNSVTTLLFFIAILWMLSGTLEFSLWGHDVRIHGYLVWVAVLYSGIGTIVAIYVGRPLIRLDYAQEKVEGNFRFAMARTREYVEPIAFYHGENAEKNHLLRLFDAVVDNAYLIIKRVLKFNMFSNIFTNLPNLLPIVACAPRYFAGVMSFGDLMQVRGAFSSVQDSLSFLANAYPLVASLAASTDRLADFQSKMNDVVRKKDPRSFVDQTFLELKHVSLLKPSHDILTMPLSLKIEAGDRILLQGASGLGKSTLLRAIAGLWPYVQGHIHLPEHAHIAFTSQKPYMPLGTLKEALAYPQQTSFIDLENLGHWMDSCGLAHLKLELNSKKDWGACLSLGEQQRVAFIRILLQKPDWIILDEATSSLDENLESILYMMMLKYLPDATVISVGHRESMVQFHTRFLRFHAKNGQTYVDEILI